MDIIIEYRNEENDYIAYLYGNKVVYGNAQSKTSAVGKLMFELAAIYSEYNPVIITDRT